MVQCSISSVSLSLPHFKCAITRMRLRASLNWVFRALVSFGGGGGGGLDRSSPTFPTYLVVNPHAQVGSNETGHQALLISGYADFNVMRASDIFYIYWQGKSEELIAATGLVILLKLASNHRFFFARMTLQFDGWPWITIRHISYATSISEHHFKAIGGFKLELQPNSGQNRRFFCPVLHWNLADDLEKQKTMSSSVHHFITIRVKTIFKFIQFRTMHKWNLNIFGTCGNTYMEFSGSFLHTSTNDFELISSQDEKKCHGHCTFHVFSNFLLPPSRSNIIRAFLRGLPLTLKLQKNMFSLGWHSRWPALMPLLSSDDCLQDAGMLEPGILYSRFAAHFGFHRDTVLNMWKQYRVFHFMCLFMFPPSACDVKGIWYLH